MGDSLIWNLGPTCYLYKWLTDQYLPHVVGTSKWNQLLRVTEGVFGVQGPARNRTWNICMARQRPPGAQNQMCTLCNNLRTRDRLIWFVCLFAKLRIHYLEAQFSANAYNREYFSLTDKVSANIIEWFKSEGKVSDSMVYAPSVFANLEPSKVWLRGPILPCACCPSGRALTLFLGKVSLGSSTVRASTVPEGSSPVE